MVNSATLKSQQGLLQVTRLNLRMSRRVPKLSWSQLHAAPHSTWLRQHSEWFLVPNTRPPPSSVLSPSKTGWDWPPHRWSRSISSLATSLSISSFLSLRATNSTILRQRRTFSHSSPTTTTWQWSTEPPRPFFHYLTKLLSDWNWLDRLPKYWIYQFPALAKFYLWFLNGAVSIQIM
jgi:hypothetical protein